MKKCIYCESEVADDVMQCENCGSKDLKNICINCGTEFDDMKCPACGIMVGKSRGHVFIAARKHLKKFVRNAGRI